MADKQMNWKGVIIPALVVIVLVVAVSLVTIFTKSKGSNINSQMTGEFEKRYDACLKINVENNRNFCLMKLAIDSGDSKFCEGMLTNENDAMFYACKDKGWESGTCDYAVYIGQTTNDCEKSKLIATIKNGKADSEYCRSYKPELTEFCQEQLRVYSIKQKTNFCGIDDACNLEYAFKLEDIDACQKIEGAHLRSMCYTYLSIKKDDKNICKLNRCELFYYDEDYTYICNKNILTNKEDVFCRWITSLKQEEPNLCNDLDYERSEKNGKRVIDFTPACILGIASLKDDSVICDLIPEDSENSVDYKKICLSNVKKDGSICKDMGPKTDASLCYGSYCNRYTSSSGDENRLCNEYFLKLYDDSKYSKFILLNFFRWDQ